jgi:hypothetical protein
MEKFFHAIKIFGLSTFSTGRIGAGSNDTSANTDGISFIHKCCPSYCTHREEYHFLLGYGISSSFEALTEIPLISGFL